jgi:hypothetical protein
MAPCSDNSGSALDKEEDGHVARIDAHRLYRPCVATVLTAGAVFAAATNQPQAVPLIALSALSALACVVTPR